MHFSGIVRQKCEKSYLLLHLSVLVRCCYKTNGYLILSCLALAIEDLNWFWKWKSPFKSFLPQSLLVSLRFCLVVFFFVLFLNLIFMLVLYTHKATVISFRFKTEIVAFHQLSLHSTAFPDATKLTRKLLIKATSRALTFKYYVTQNIYKLLDSFALNWELREGTQGWSVS